MALTSGRIRVLALGLIRDGDRLFVSEGYDPDREQTYYRALGGGVEFGEPSRDALHREFWEELQVKLKDVHYLGCLENIFTYNNQPGHELIQLYRCSLADPGFYQRETIQFQEGDRVKTALWVDVNRFHSGELILYPTGFLDFVD
jgi:8-oxo-dGTP pyrophosphatase MutT (NUDIX family)